MTTRSAKITPADIAARLLRFEETCRAQGLRITPQRLEIFKELAASTEHPSAEQIYARIRVHMPTISLDTVYRTLATLSSHGIIGRVEALDDRGRFDANTDQHHHFVCTRCQRVVDIYWPDFDQLKLPKDVARIGKIEQPYAELRGICRECLAAEAS